jgi:hypothetical protein
MKVTKNSGSTVFTFFHIYGLILSLFNKAHKCRKNKDRGHTFLISHIIGSSIINIVGKLELPICEIWKVCEVMIDLSV